MDLLVAFASLFVAWFLVLTIPGPNFVAVTQYSVSESRRTGFYIALGVSAGAATWASASLLGISAIFEYATWLYRLIQIIGGLYLGYLGLKTILSSFQRQERISHSQQQSQDSTSVFRLGLFTSYANPKTAVFFGSLFIVSFPPQAPLWFYFATVAMVFSASVLWYSLVAYFFSVEKVQAFYNKFRWTTDKITGSIFLYLGLRLVFSGK